MSPSVHLTEPGHAELPATVLEGPVSESSAMKCLLRSRKKQLTLSGDVTKTAAPAPPHLGETSSNM